MIHNIGDVYTLQERETQKWFAFQIIQLKGNQPKCEDWVAYVDLDYWSERKPTSDDLINMHVLRLNHHFWENGVQLCWAPCRWFPLKAEFVGNVPVLYDGECKSYGKWPDGAQQKLTEKWLQLPTDQVTAYKHALDEWKRNKSLFFAGEEIRRGLWCVNDDRLDAIDDYSELDKLQGLSRVETTRYRPQLIPFLERRWLVRELVWGHCGQKVLDLRSTHIEQLEVNDPDVQEIYLPQGIQNVTLKGLLSPYLRIFSHDDGYSLALEVELQDDHLPDVGLPKLMKLVLNNIKDFDLSTIITRHPNLIWLGLNGHPGIINNVSCIKQLKELETLLIFDLFGFSYDDFPLPADLSNLQWLWLQSVPADAGKAIKRLYKNKIQDLVVSKLRSNEWLQENMNNPLRHWDGSEFIPKSKYNKAVALWKEARHKIFDAAKEPKTFSDSILSIASDYIEGFNKLDRRSGFIETEEREDIINAFESILDDVDLKIDRERLQKVMDEKRTW